LWGHEFAGAVVVLDCEIGGLSVWVSDSGEESFAARGVRSLP
jgi:hypothetical protein